MDKVRMRRCIDGYQGYAECFLFFLSEILKIVGYWVWQQKKARKHVHQQYLPFRVLVLPMECATPPPENFRDESRAQPWTMSQCHWSIGLRKPDANRD